MLEKERSARRVCSDCIGHVQVKQDASSYTEGETEYFPIEVGVHQGSALSPPLFIIIMDVLTENIEKDPPSAMMFADGALCYDS